MCNEYGQCYLTRGGKRRYYLSEKFIYQCLCLDKDAHVEKDVKLSKTLVGLEEIKRRLKPGSKNYTKVTQLINLIYGIDTDGWEL